MSLGKSLFIAISATGTSLAAVAVAGLLTNSGPLALGPDAEEPAPEQAAVALRTIVMEPVPLDPRGYSLTGLEQGDQVFVSVEMVMHRKDDRKLVCTLMPRLRAAILRDLGPKLWFAPKNLGIDEEGVNEFLRARFDNALGGNVVAQVSVRFRDRRPLGPKPNCTEALHGGWQAWIRRTPGGIFAKDR